MDVNSGCSQQLLGVAGVLIAVLVMLITPVTPVVTTPAPTVAAITTLSATAMPGEAVNNPCTGQPFVTIATGSALKSAKAVVQFETQWAIEFNLDITNDEAQRFSAFTAANKGQQLAMVIDGQVISAPTIYDTIVDRGIISSTFTEAEAKALAAQLDSGTLPVQLVLSEVVERTEGVRLVFDFEPAGDDTLATLRAVLERRLTASGIAEFRIELQVESKVVIDINTAVDLSQIVPFLLRQAFLEFVDFSRPANCNAEMPIAGQFIITDRRS